MTVPLLRIAHARSGDKGDTANIGLLALEDRHYPVLLREVTEEKVRLHLSSLCDGEVIRYPMPNISGMNFLIRRALAGGGTVSTRTDAQGKTLAAALLRMTIELGEDEL